MISASGWLFNPLNAELNPICHLLALLGGATIVVVSRLRVEKKNTNPILLTEYYVRQNVTNSLNNRLPNTLTAKSKPISLPPIV